MGIWVSSFRDDGFVAGFTGQEPPKPKAADLSGNDSIIAQEYADGYKEGADKFAECARIINEMLGNRAIGDVGDFRQFSQWLMDGGQRMEDDLGHALLEELHKRMLQAGAKAKTDMRMG
ncbi:hypothetical protein EGJ86_22275 [Pseudomonas sp. o96-267]|uniref:hypothetical protein n=1 Tax=Pseudomonas sp. o96-267 TaxID=2479853 RepID=UPI000F77CCBC|nr:MULTISPECIES: hypothetical protein [Pseudomonas]MDH0960903.1 hypothetical protein [Pseudomonas chengduensis]MDV5863679.1 hypothetical protein [Pseudomonas mendocina]RRV29968.1 hypothetical protein EGJ86_22275 [Pseudomonas sp. o96-267]